MTANIVADALARQEAIIERGLTSFLEVGDALLKIRADRLYLQTHETFSDYCLERWGFSDARARQLTIAAKTVTNVTAAGLEPPTRESQARELARVPEADRAQVWRETLDRTDGNPTAAAIRETAADSAPAAAAPAAADRAPDPAADRDADAARQRRTTLRTARRTADRIVSSLRCDVVSIVAGIELGETDLITAQMVADLRAAVGVLEAQLAAQAGGT